MLGLPTPISETTEAISSAFNSTIIEPAARQAQKVLSPTIITQAREDIRQLEPPTHWDIDYYSVNGIDVPRYISEAKEPVVEFDFCTGFNSTPLVYAPIIEIMNKLGISVFATKLLQDQELGTDNPEELIDFHRDSTQNFFTSPRVREHNTNIAKVAGTHSAAGGNFSSHLTDIESLIEITENFNGGALHITPFYDVANASKRFHPKKHKSFMKYAEDNRNELTSDTLGGQIVSTYNRIKGEPQIFSADKDPTYGEILALRGQLGDTTIAALEELNWQPVLRQRFAIATEDTASCSLTAELVAKLQGAETTEYNAYHNPPLESAQDEARVINRVLKMGESASNEPITQYTKPKHQAACSEPSP